MFESQTRDPRHHVIFSTYGFWLPNDPRGSWSDFVGAWELFRNAGPATKVTSTRSFAHDPHDRVKRLEAKQRLKRAPVRFTDAQRRALASGFERAVRESVYTVYALAVLRDHVHIVLAFHERSLAQIIGHLKSRATMELRAANIHPFERDAGGLSEVPTCWGGPGWKVFIDNPAQVRTAIRYVNENPGKEGLPEQQWGFVKPLPEWISRHR